MSSQLRHVIDNGKKLVKQQHISSHVHNMANFGPLTDEIDWRVWGTPANFNGFCSFPSLLQRCRSLKANQTLHGVWPSPGLVHYIHFWGLLPLTEFCAVQSSLYAQVLHSPIYLVLLHGTPAAGDTSAELCGMVQGMELRNFRRRRHLYSAGQPSRLASAHILVVEFD